jgi:hypothetical protein
MGGNSASAIEHAPDVGPRVARWKGELILEVRKRGGANNVQC